MFETHIYCDGCGDVLYRCNHARTFSTHTMIEYARKIGWSIGKYHLCVECKNKKKQLKEEGYLK